MKIKKYQQKKERQKNYFIEATILGDDCWFEYEKPILLGYEIFHEKIVLGECRCFLVFHFGNSASWRTSSGRENVMMFVEASMDDNTTK